MRTDISDDEDEDWYDDDRIVEDDLFDDEPEANCPECGGTVYSFSDNCPHCGYWLSAADRRAMYRGESKPFWLRVTAAIVLLAILISLLAFGAVLF